VLLDHESLTRNPNHRALDREGSSVVIDARPIDCEQLPDLAAEAEY
jgi:hypothetical protein